MKSRPNTFVRFSSILAATVAIAFSSSAHALDFTWEGTTGNWNDASWNDGTTSGLTGPTTAGNTATINIVSNVTANVGVGALDSVTLGSGAQLNFYNGAYQGVGNLILQGGTVSGSGNYNAYGASVLGNLTVSGSAASTITGSSWFNLGSSTTFTVADATGDSASDLLVNLSLRSLPGSPDTSYLYNSKIIKEGAGTMEVTVHSYFNGGLDLNGGTLSLSGGNGGYGFFDGAVNVNSGTTLSIASDGTGFGYQSGWKPASVNILGGTVTGTGGNHVWGISGGVNMTGGTFESAGFQWNFTNLNTNASADTATLAGPLNLRGDGGYTGLSADVADGAAATDLLISGNITEQYGSVGITKSGDGTMEMAGANSYSGTTTVNGGTLVISGSSVGTGAIQVNAGTLSLSNPVLDDGAAVAITTGATVDLNFVGNDTVGSLDIDGSGPLPAGSYNSSHPTYGSFFTGGGSLVIAGADGTWTSLVDGDWTDAANWQSNIIAAGINATATFNAATGVTVTLPSNRIIGNLAFDVSDYVLAGAGTLTLDAAANPAISVTTGRIATISANLGGIAGMEKTGAGTLVLNGVKSYTGGTTVTAGTLELNSATADLSAVSGSLIVASGATLQITGADYTGLGRLGARITALEVDGGTVDNTIESWVTGASVNLTGATMSGGRYQIISSGFNSIDSDTTSTISSNLLIRKDYGSADLSIDVGDGTAATDLLVSGNIGEVLSAGVNKYGPGKLLLSGTNTYTGNTVVDDGTLEVNSASGLRFRPTTNGANNAVSGSSTATLSFLGTVDLDLATADLTNGNAWTLFDLASFTGPLPTLTPTAVTSTAGSFGQSGTTWTLIDGANTWTFEETTGVLSLAVAGGNDYDTWGSTYGLTVGSEGGDLDNDGVTNGEEYAFGLIPNSGSSVNAITVPLDKTGGTFSYTRRLQSLTSLTYTVWYSTDLATWTQDSGAVEGTPSVIGEVETVPVTLTGTLLTNPKLFIQVRAE